MERAAIPIPCTKIHNYRVGRIISPPEVPSSIRQCYFQRSPVDGGRQVLACHRPLRRLHVLTKVSGRLRDIFLRFCRWQSNLPHVGVVMLVCSCVRHPVFPGRNFVGNRAALRVEQAPAGLTASELQDHVECGSQTTLAPALSAQRLDRRVVGGVYVYFSREAGRQREQRLRRESNRQLGRSRSPRWGASCRRN